MDSVLNFSSLFAATVTGTLLSAIWEGAVLALAVAAVLRLLPRLSATARSVIWMNVFLFLLLLQLLPLIAHHVNAVGPARYELNALWGFAIAGIWAAFSCFRGLQLAWGAVHLNRLANSAMILAPDEALSAVLQTKTLGGRTRTAQLCASAQVERPSVFGFLRPRILVPPDLLKRLSAEQLRQVVLHEMEHLRRADDWTNLVQKLAIVLFPINPVLLWVERRICVERELACDDRVLRSSCGRKAYAICLTRLAEHGMLQRGISLALGAWERQSELVRRVHRILRLPGGTMSRRWTIALSGGLSLCVLAGALALARSPRLVSFAPLVQNGEQARLIQTPNLRTSSLLAPESASLRGPTLRNYPAIQMLKAEVPDLGQSAHDSANPIGPAKSMRKNAVLPHARPSRLEDRQAWVVMTDWSDEGVVSQLVLTSVQSGGTPVTRLKGKTAESYKVSYAAVRVPYGWLIVQV
jgi:hypothetical protein